MYLPSINNSFVNLDNHPSISTYGGKNYSEEDLDNTLSDNWYSDFESNVFSSDDNSWGF